MYDFKMVRKSDISLLVDIMFRSFHDQIKILGSLWEEKGLVEVAFHAEIRFFPFWLTRPVFAKKWLHHRLEILTKLIITKMSSPSNSLLLFLFSLKEQKVGARNEPPARFAPSCSDGKKKKNSARRQAVMVTGSCRSLDRWTFHSVVCKTFFSSVQYILK